MPSMEERVEVAMVAYVGTSSNLCQRITQHLIRLDSSVATGTSAAGLNVDYVTGLDWWKHPGFSERDALRAAESVAFQVLDPAVRIRSNITNGASALLGKLSQADSLPHRSTSLEEG